MKKAIYVFGNPLVEEDSLPLKIASKLGEIFPDIEFIVKDPNDNLEPKNGELWIIDTIRVNSGQWTANSEKNKILVIDDLDKIQLNKIYSAHDFDLGFNLKLLRKIGKLKKVVIFGVPVGIGNKKALDQLVAQINIELKKKKENDKVFI